MGLQSNPIPQQNDMPVILTQNLSKAFRNARRKTITLAVNDLNLSVESGQVYGFLGPNGAGKSTTLRMLLNLVHPTQGHVLIFGENPQDNPKILRRVGAMVEGAAFYPYLNAWDNLRIMGQTHGGFDEKRARQLLDFVGLTGKEKTRFGKYSTGMKQRFGIAATLLHDPQLIMLDEPTNGMDPMGMQTMRHFIRDLAKVHGKTVFLTSHLLDEVQQTCDVVSIINDGQLQVTGTIKELLHQDSRILVEVSDAPQAVNALAAYQAEIVAGATPCIRVSITHAETPALIRTLVTAGVDIFKVMPDERRLEEFFLEVVGASSDSAKGRLQ